MPLALQIFLLAVLILAAGAGIAYLAQRKAPSADNRQVTLQVEASGGYATITWKVGTGNVEKMDNATVPWQRMLSLKQGTQVILTAATTVPVTKAPVPNTHTSGSGRGRSPIFRFVHHVMYDFMTRFTLR